MRPSAYPQSAPAGNTSRLESPEVRTTRQYVQQIVELPEWWTDEEDWTEDEERKFIRSNN